MRLKLVKTCGACPEQYDVFQGEELVGYLRLCHRMFRAECRGKVVHVSYPRGDGRFEEAERVQHLNAACRAIEEELDGGPGRELPIYDLGEQVDD